VRGPSGAGKNPFAARPLALLEIRFASRHDSSCRCRPPGVVGVFLPRWRSRAAFISPKRPSAQARTRLEAKPALTPWSFQERRGRAGLAARAESRIAGLAALGREFHSSWPRPPSALQAARRSLLALLRPAARSNRLPADERDGPSLGMGPPPGALEALLIAWLGAGPAAPARVHQP